MATLKETLETNLKTGMKNADQETVGILRLLLAAIKNEEIVKRGKTGESILTEEETQAILKREAKKRKEAIELYTKAGRSELAEKEEKELGFIKSYLPEEISSEKIKEIVGRVISKGNKEFGSIMREAMKELGGQADGKIVAEIIKSSLENS